jgi:hypothetical protein
VSQLEQPPRFFLDRRLGRFARSFSRVATPHGEMPRPGCFFRWVCRRTLRLGIDMGTIGALTRTLAPLGGVAPLAGQIEYRWPISRDDEPSGLPDDEELFHSLLSGGDLRDQARDLAMTTPIAEMLDAFDLAAGLPGWADGTCAAVEREIAAGKLGGAANEWAVSSALGGGLTRLLLTMALRDKKAGPASTAITALVLIFVRIMIRALRQLVPNENFEVLNNPLIAPSFLLDFLNR